MGNAATNKCITSCENKCLCDPNGQASTDGLVVGEIVDTKGNFPRFEVTTTHVVDPDEYRANVIDPANADVDPHTNSGHVLRRSFVPKAEPPEPPAAAPAAGQKRDKHTFENGIVYDGQWSGQTRHGHGIQVWPDGAMYEGQWEDDQAHGEGRFNHVDGDMYVGQWCEDKAQGRGIYFHADGSKYEGEWSEDNRHGTGVEIWPDGAKYDGQYADGLKNGMGKFILPNGSKYLGEFLHNDIHGAGLYEWFDGRKYQGQYAKNQMHGAGVFTGADGHSYDGQYISDQKEGFGVFSWPDGCKYAGQWRQGRQHGTGALATAEGETKHGSWKDGRLRDPGLYDPGEEDPITKLPPARPRQESPTPGQPQLEPSPDQPRAVSPDDPEQRRLHPDSPAAQPDIRCRSPRSPQPPQRRVVTGIVPPAEQGPPGSDGWAMPGQPPQDLQQVNIQPGEFSERAAPLGPPPPPAEDSDIAGASEDFRLPSFQAPRQEDKGTRGCCSFSWAMPKEDGTPRVQPFGSLPSPEEAAAAARDTRQGY